jgi:hypothetical protein
MEGKVIGRSARPGFRRRTIGRELDVGRSANSAATVQLEQRPGDRLVLGAFAKGRGGFDEGPIDGHDGAALG